MTAVPPGGPDDDRITRTLPRVVVPDAETDAPPRPKAAPAAAGRVASDRVAAERAAALERAALERASAERAAAERARATVAAPVPAAATRPPGPARAPRAAGSPPVAAVPTPSYRPDPDAVSPRAAARGRTGVRAAARQPRRARLRLTHVDPWSALKVSLVFAACLFVVWLVAVIVLFGVLQSAGVFDSINSTLSDVLGTHIDFSGAIIVGGAAVIGALSVVIVTALGTIIAVAYNITASLLGGLDVTLTETD